MDNGDEEVQSWIQVLLTSVKKDDVKSVLRIIDRDMIQLFKEDKEKAINNGCVEVLICNPSNLLMLSL